MIRYFPANRGYTQDEAFEVKEHAVDADQAAELCAEDYHSAHDGWEARWPIDIEFMWNGEWYTATVEREVAPSFYATSVLPAPEVPE